MRLSPPDECRTVPGACRIGEEGSLPHLPAVDSHRVCITASSPPPLPQHDFLLFTVPVRNISIEPTAFSTAVSPLSSSPSAPVERMKPSVPLAPIKLVECQETDTTETQRAVDESTRLCDHCPTLLYHIAFATCPRTGSQYCSSWNPASRMAAFPLVSRTRPHVISPNGFFYSVRVSLVTKGDKETLPKNKRRRQSQPIASDDRSIGRR